MALLSFGASAWKLGERERFIGWSEPQRQKNLQLVVNDALFLILPWIQRKGLASMILALAARQPSRDWQQRYGYQPGLWETFVEPPRLRGICCKAANWVLIGQTVGRGIWMTRYAGTSAPSSASSAALRCYGFTEYLHAGTPG